MLDPLGHQQPGIDQNPEMLGGGGLGKAELFLDSHRADPVRNQIAIDLRGKTADRIAQPFEHLAALRVGYRLDLAFEVRVQLLP